MTNSCMITGHRQIPDEKIASVKEQIAAEISKAIKKGYTHYISGFANGVDLYFAEIVVELKNSHNITLEAAIPHRNRINVKDREFQRLLSCCDTVGVHSEEYSLSVFMKRNRYMVKQSDFVIAVYDGRHTGGTLATIEYARALKKEIKLILI